jgi:hypothetical protein
MNTAYFTSKLVVTLLTQAAVSVKASASDVDPYFGDRVVPLDLRQWLAQLRLLQYVPFCYLVADSLLLPPESIRFFYVDRNWTDAFVQGALSAGAANSADRAQLEQLHKQIRDEIDEEERLVRAPGGEPPQKGPAGTITGFLVRSRAVSGWPGMHVRAYRKELSSDTEIVPESSPDRIKCLRLERLAPAVMLALFDGVPVVMHLEEPRQGVQFGIRLAPTNTPNQFTSTVIARDVTTSIDVVPQRLANVTFRRGSPGVLDLKRTAQTLIATPGTKMGAALDGAEFALEMIRFPFRQVFGDPSKGDPGNIADVFRPAISLAQLKATFQERI